MESFEAELTRATAIDTGDVLGAIALVVDADRIVVLIIFYARIPALIHTRQHALPTRVRAAISRT